MNDRRVNELVRMAMEVEEMERESGSPQLRLAGDSDGVAVRRGGGAWWWGVGLAAAAGLALVFALPALTHTESAPGKKDVLAMGTSPDRENPVIVRHIPLGQITDLNPSRPIVYPAAANVAERVDPGLVERCMVMAIYRGPRGAMQCVKVKPHEWSENRCLSEITPQELKCVSVGQACSSSADHALLVALSGPQKSLPRTENEAVGLANCILGRPCENDSKCYSLSAADCLPAGVSVKIETVADSR